MVTEPSWWIHTADVAQLKGRVHGSGNDQGYRGLTSPQARDSSFHLHDQALLPTPNLPPYPSR